MPGPDVLALLIPIFALLIPIIAVLTKHQRSMAELYVNRNPQFNANSPELQAMRREIDELKQLMMQQTIALDNLANVRSTTPPAMPTEVQERLGASNG